MRQCRWICAGLAVFLLIIGGTVWVVALNSEPGTRVSIVWPGRASNFSMGGNRQLELAPELVQQKVAAEIIAMRGETKQTFILRREKRILELQITAGDRAIQPGDLRYVLLDVAGNEIGSGPVQQENAIAPNASAKCTIADFAVQEAWTVRILRVAR